jgi:hypothetical protein
MRLLGALEKGTLVSQQAQNSPFSRLRTASRAYGGWSSAFGIVLTGISIAKIYTRWFEVELHGLVRELFDAYAGFFHQPVLELFKYLEWPQPAGWLIDLAVIHIIVAAVTFRTVIAIRGEIRREGELFQQNVADRYALTSHFIRSIGGIWYHILFRNVHNFKPKGLAYPRIGRRISKVAHVCFIGIICFLFPYYFIYKITFLRFSRKLLMENRQILWDDGAQWMSDEMMLTHPSIRRLDRWIKEGHVPHVTYTAILLAQLLAAIFAASMFIVLGIYQPEVGIS